MYQAYYKPDDPKYFYIVDIDDDNEIRGAVNIAIFEERAYLEDLFHIDENITTIKVALEYLFTNHKDVTKVEIEDYVQSKETGVFITQGNIVLHKPSWYEEMLGAVMSQTTRVNIKRFVDRTERCTDYCTAYEFYGELSYLIGNTFHIFRNISKIYDSVSVTVCDSTPEWFDMISKIEDAYNTFKSTYRTLKYDWHHAKREWYNSNE